ncbi:cell surface A33 antigen-like [Colossoma macropomum]|uniref:cell surface A33 antigen-like n=1 Tax=Colossoma macropomum TaxID=42526 RepID=UPI001864F755|nr:cell surface A33 antigen-like [Colossoma macropomum]
MLMATLALSEENTRKLLLKDERTLQQEASAASRIPSIFLRSGLLNQREKEREVNSSVLSVKMWLCVFLLYSVLQESSGCTVERGLGAVITKSVGDSVVLPCSCTNLQDDPQTVQWGFLERIIIGNYTAELSVFPQDGSQNQRYRNRVQRLNQNKPGDLSLIISHLTEKDEGTYLCCIKKTYSRAINLYVRGCTALCVRERTFTRSPGESVLLPCPCPRNENKIYPKRVTWTKDQTAVCNDTESYRGRVWMFDQNHSRNFSLLISDLTKEDSGDYTCNADDHTPYVTLHVKVKKEITGQSDFSTVIVITLCVCVVLLLIGLIGESALICKLRQKWTQGSVSTNTEKRTQNTADGDYENGPLRNHNKISMGPIYQSLDPNINQSDSVYQSLDTNTIQSDSVYKSRIP